jgi:hypothetical protein
MKYYKLYSKEGGTRNLALERTKSQSEIQGGAQGPTGPPACVDNQPMPCPPDVTSNQFPAPTMGNTLPLANGALLQHSEQVENGNPLRRDRL